MRYLELSVDQAPDERHPMHRFVVEHDAYGVTRLLYRHQYAETEHALLFHIDGPVDPYESAIDELSSVREFELAPCPDVSFYLYLRERLSEYDQAFADALTRSGLLLIRPIEYRSDGTTRLTAVGPTEAVQGAVDDVSATSGVEVLTVGEYAAGRIDARVGLTPRQFEAVAEAVDSGCYNATRNATLEDIASRLGCSSGTAGELLRRAERTVMSDLVAGGPF